MQSTARTCVKTRAARAARFFLGSLRACILETQTTTGSELFSFLTCLYTTTFAKYLYSIGEDSNKNLGDTIILAHEMFSSRLPSASQKRACLSFLLLFCGVHVHVHDRVVHVDLKSLVRRRTTTRNLFVKLITEQRTNKV